LEAQPVTRWQIHLIEDPVRRWSRYLGDVEAANHPAALLAAYQQFEITENREQRKVHAGRKPPYGANHDHNYEPGPCGVCRRCGGEQH
jgi:hypothetical protein